MSDDLEWSRQVNIMVAKANRILGMLKRTFEISEATLRARWASLESSLASRHRKN